MKIAVAGGKGGVGKSTVAYNLGAALDAVVLDGDIGMADLPAGAGPDLHDVLAGRAAVRAAVDRRGSVRIVPSGRTLAGARDTDPTALADVISELEATFERVVIDCPGGLRADVGIPLYVADCCLPVTTASRTAVTDALRTRGMAVSYDAGLVRVVLNRAGQNPPVQAVERVFGAPVIPIPETEELEISLEINRPVTESQPDSLAAHRFRSLATTLDNSLNPLH